MTDAYQTSDLRLFAGGTDWLADLSGFTGSVVGAGDVEQQPLVVLDELVVEQITLKVGHSVSPGALYAGVETEKLRGQTAGFLALVSLVPKACFVMQSVHPGNSIQASNETVVVHNTAFSQAGPHYVGRSSALTRVESFAAGADVADVDMAQGETAFVVVTVGSGDFSIGTLAATASGVGIYSLGTATAAINNSSLTVPAGASGYLLVGAVGSLES